MTHGERRGGDGAASIAVFVGRAQAAQVRRRFVVLGVVTATNKFDDSCASQGQALVELEGPDVACSVRLGCGRNDVPVQVRCECAESLTTHEAINIAVDDLRAQISEELNVRHVIGKIDRQLSAGEDFVVGSDRDTPVLKVQVWVKPVVVFKNGLAAVTRVNALHEARSGVGAGTQSPRDVVHVLIEHCACCPVDNAAGATVAVDLSISACLDGVCAYGSEGREEER